MEKDHLKIWQKTTPSQRLEWLEKMLKFLKKFQKKKELKCLKGFALQKSMAKSLERLLQ